MRGGGKAVASGGRRVWGKGSGRDQQPAEEAVVVEVLRVDGRQRVDHVRVVVGPGGLEEREGGVEQLGREQLDPLPVRPPELKVRTPAHTKQLGWDVEFEFRGTAPRDAAVVDRVLAVEA